MGKLDENTRLVNKSEQLDDIDKLIINELINDSRISYSDLAEKIHLSRVSVRERITKLKENGIITNFTIFVDSSKIGLTTSVFFDIKAETAKIHSVAQKLAEFEEITIVYQTTGNTSLHVHAMIEDFEGIGKFMHEKLYTIDGITNVISHVLLKKYKSLLTCT